MEGKLLLDALLEGHALLEGQGVGLGNDRDDVDNVGQLLQNHNINGLQRVARGLDKEQAAVNASVLDVALALGGELLAKVRRVLVLDVFDDRVPAAVIVDQVAVSGSVDDVKPQADTVLLDDVRHGVNLGRGADHLLRVVPALALDQVRGEDGVDQGRLAQTGLACATERSIPSSANVFIVGYDYALRESAAQRKTLLDAWAGGGIRLDHARCTRRGCHEELTNADDVELEAALQQLALDLGRDAVETDMALWVDGGCGHGRHGCWWKMGDFGRRLLLPLLAR